MGFLTKWKARRIILKGKLREMNIDYDRAMALNYG